MSFVFAACFFASLFGGLEPDHRPAADGLLISGADSGLSQDSPAGEKEKPELTEEEKVKLQKRQLRLQAGIPKLFAAKGTYYNDRLQLLYHHSEDFKTATRSNGASDKSLHFDLSRSGVPRNIFHNICFAGSETGGLRLTQPFTGKTRVRALVAVQGLEKASSFELQLLEDEKQYLATSFGTHLIEKRTKKKRPKLHRCREKAFAGLPMKWLDRKVLAQITVEYDPETNEVRCGYSKGPRTSITVPPLQGQDPFTKVSWTNTVKLKKPMSPTQIGFRWHKCRFIVLGVKIDSGLDVDWAEKELDKLDGKKK